MSNLRKIGNTVKNGIITGFQGTCSGVHLGLRYGIDLVEESEVSFMRKFTGQAREDTVRDRRNTTNRTRLEINRSVSEVRLRALDMFSRKFNSVEAVMVETELHGNS